MVEKMAPSRCSDLARAETRAPPTRSGPERAAMTGPKRCWDCTKADCSDLCYSKETAKAKKWGCPCSSGPRLAGETAFR